MLAEVAAQPHRADARVLGRDAGNHIPGTVRTPIVHEYDLEASDELLERADQSLMKRGQALDAAVNGDDDAQLGRG
jgi:hypothetical protein